MSIEKAGTNIVNNGTTEELQKYLVESEFKSDEALKTELNRLLVRSLLAGRQDMFDYLAIPQPSEEKPLADISALNAANLNQYLGARDFNVGDEPFRGLDEASKPNRLIASQAILDDIKAGRYGDPKDIALPPIATFFAHEPLVDQLIAESRESKAWDFNQRIGTRDMTALSCAIALDSTDSNTYQNIAMKVIKTAEDTGLDITNQPRTGISSLYATGQLEKTQKYLEAMGSTPLGISELQELIISTNTAIVNATGGNPARGEDVTLHELRSSELCADNTGIIGAIATKIAADLSNPANVQSIESMIDSIDRQAETYITDPEIYIDRAQLLTVTFLKMLPNNEKGIKVAQTLQESLSEIIELGTKVSPAQQILDSTTPSSSGFFSKASTFLKNSFNKFSRKSKLPDSASPDSKTTSADSGVPSSFDSERSSSSPASSDLSESQNLTGSRDSMVLRDGMTTSPPPSVSADTQIKVSPKAEKTKHTDDSCVAVTTPSQVDKKLWQKKHPSNGAAFKAVKPRPNPLEISKETLEPAEITHTRKA